MAKHLDIGKYGEKLAQQYVLQLGYEILCRNWRFKNLEVDLIVRDMDTLVFVEVKTRSGEDFGKPFEFVDVAKKRKLMRAAERYLVRSGHTGDIRFDIISLTLKPELAIEYIKDAFWNE